MTKNDGLGCDTAKVTYNHRAAPALAPADAFPRHGPRTVDRMWPQSPPYIA